MCNFLFQNNDSLDELLKSFLMDELEPGTGDQSSEGEWGGLGGWNPRSVPGGYRIQSDEGCLRPRHIDQSTIRA